VKSSVVLLLRPDRIWSSEAPEVDLLSRSSELGQPPLVLLGHHVRTSASVLFDSDFAPSQLLVRHGQSWRIDDVAIDGVTVLVDPGPIDGVLFDDEVPSYLKLADRRELADRRARKIAWRTLVPGGEIAVTATLLAGDQADQAGSHFQGVVFGMAALRPGRRRRRPAMVGR
jgi:hypothetical protein